MSAKLYGTHATIVAALAAWGVAHPEDSPACDALIDGIDSGRLHATERPAPRGFDFTLDGGEDHALVVRALAASTQAAPFMSAEWGEYRHKLDKFQAGVLTLDPQEDR